MTKRSSLYAALAVPLAALLAACGSPTLTAMPTATATPSSIDASGVIPILATTVLRPGTQRVAFILEGAKALVTEPVVTVTSRASTAPSSVVETAVARFEKWPFGTRGSYVTQLTFGEPGDWVLSIDGARITGTIDLPLEVDEESAVVDIGSLPPFSNTKTVRSISGDLSLLTSHFRQDAGLYQISVAESLFSGRPSVVVFASPAFCTSPTCGPQVDTIVELKDAHAGEADFIHVEIYDNPQEIQGDLSRGVISPHVTAWGIDSGDDYRNESWVFVLGKDGRITHRFQGYATFNEIEAALLEALA
ncbi:MAG: hypothetical protein O3B65_02795 [Chloroflexi bacterium]|nr:hypothetical protein [Chloroflexota bacterium]